MKILKFSASWCIPCQTLSKTIEKLTDEQKKVFINIDVDTCGNQMLSKYGVRSVPTLVVLKDDDSVKQMVTGGGISIQNLKALFEENF